MNNIEKLVFLEMTNKQFTKFPNSEYLNTYKNLSETKRTEFHILSEEVHQIWNKINSTNFEDIENYSINSIEEFNERIRPVSDIILKISSDFDLTLKNEISEKFKERVIKLFGKDFFDNLFSE